MCGGSSLQQVRERRVWSVSPSPNTICWLCEKPVSSTAPSHSIQHTSTASTDLFSLLIYPFCDKAFHTAQKRHWRGVSLTIKRRLKCHQTGGKLICCFQPNLVKFFFSFFFFFFFSPINCLTYKMFSNNTYHNGGELGLNQVWIYNMS